MIKDAKYSSVKKSIEVRVGAAAPTNAMLGKRADVE